MKVIERLDAVAGSATGAAGEGTLRMNRSFSTSSIPGMVDAGSVRLRLTVSNV